MIDKNFLKDYATKLETTFINVLREYAQHIFLREFYDQDDSENFLFKGGTALRLVFGSPRFSEDLDFSAKKNSGSYEKILENVLLGLVTEGIKVDLKESKPTSGGHLAVIEVELFDQLIEIQNQISFRPQAKLTAENVLVTAKIIPSYKICLLSRDILVSEKAAALIDRKKSRDFFDLYYILRHDELRSSLKLNGQQREKIWEILTNLPKATKARLATDLKRLLPKSFWPVVKDLPAILKRELQRT